MQKQISAEETLSSEAKHRVSLSVSSCCWKVSRFIFSCLLHLIFIAVKATNDVTRVRVAAPRVAEGLLGWREQRPNNVHQVGGPDRMHPKPSNEGKGRSLRVFCQGGTTDLSPWGVRFPMSDVMWHHVTSLVTVSYSAHQNLPFWLSFFFAPEDSKKNCLKIMLGIIYKTDCPNQGRNLDIKERKPKIMGPNIFAEKKALWFFEPIANIEVQWLSNFNIKQN